MRYAYVFPRVAPVVSDSVIAAREELGAAIHEGSVPKIEKAVQHLEAADRVARARRITANALKRVERSLGAPDLMWERMVNAVAGFRQR